MEKVEVLGTKLSQDKELLVFELLTPFSLANTQKAYVEFISISLRKHRIRPVKVCLEVQLPRKEEKKEIKYSFEITENIQPFNIPYLCVNENETISIFSLMTGQRVLQYSIKPSLSKAPSSFSLDALRIWRDQILASSKHSGSVLRYEIKHRLNEDIMKRLVRQARNIHHLWNWQNYSCKRMKRVKLAKYN